MNSVNLTPIDIPKKTLEVEDNDPSMLYISYDEKKMMTNAVITIFKNIADISNSIRIRKIPMDLSEQPSAMEVKWIEKSKMRLPNNKYKVSC